MPQPVPQPGLPRWVRQGAGRDDPGTALFSAGAALALLDPAARSDDPVCILWRRRLALASAVAVAGLEGRREGEAQLRDGLAFLRPGDDPGPAGRLLQAWRHLGEARALRVADWPGRLPAFFDLPGGALTAELQVIGDRWPGRDLPLRYAAEAAAQVLAAGPAQRAVALWLADAQLGRALGWARPVPLLAAHLPRAAFRATGDAWLNACAMAWGKAAIAAVDLHGDLARRAEALRQAAPRLRGRDAAATVTGLLTEDALAAQAGERASDRAARRLFERLTAQGLVRELTGRQSFRLYGL